MWKYILMSPHSVLTSTLLSIRHHPRWHRQWSCSVFSSGFPSVPAINDHSCVQVHVNVFFLYISKMTNCTIVCSAHWDFLSWLSLKTLAEWDNQPDYIICDWKRGAYRITLRHRQEMISLRTKFYYGWGQTEWLLERLRKCVVLYWRQTWTGAATSMEK